MRYFIAILIYPLVWLIIPVLSGIFLRFFGLLSLVDFSHGFGFWFFNLLTFFYTFTAGVFCGYFVKTRVVSYAVLTSVLGLFFWSFLPFILAHVWWA